MARLLKGWLGSMLCNIKNVRSKVQLYKSLHFYFYFKNAICVIKHYFIIFSLKSHLHYFIFFQKNFCERAHTSDLSVYSLTCYQLYHWAIMARYLIYIILYIFLKFYEKHLHYFIFLFLLLNHLHFSFT